MEGCNGRVHGIHAVSKFYVEDVLAPVVARVENLPLFFDVHLHIGVEINANVGIRNGMSDQRDVSGDITGGDIKGTTEGDLAFDAGEPGETSDSEDL